jgi:hypothetical protein
MSRHETIRDDIEAKLYTYWRSTPLYKMKQALGEHVPEPFTCSSCDAQSKGRGNGMSPAEVNVRWVDPEGRFQLSVHAKPGNAYRDWGMSLLPRGAYGKLHSATVAFDATHGGAERAEECFYARNGNRYAKRYAKKGWTDRYADDITDALIEWIDKAPAWLEERATAAADRKAKQTRTVDAIRARWASLAASSNLHITLNRTSALLATRPACATVTVNLHVRRQKITPYANTIETVPGVKLSKVMQAVAEVATMAQSFAEAAEEVIGGAE